jgi:2-phospho-L-lactate guanylyltransferase (CobY/MobA/RfbA family)
MKTLIYSIFYLSVITAIGYLAYSNSSSKAWLSSVFTTQNQGKSSQEMLVDITQSINMQFQTLQQKNEVQSKTIAMLEQQMNEIKAQMKEMSDAAKTKESQQEQQVAKQNKMIVSDDTLATKIQTNQITQQQDMQAIAQRKMSLREIADKMNMKALNSLNPG